MTRPVLSLAATSAVLLGVAVLAVADGQLVPAVACAVLALIEVHRADAARRDHRHEEAMSAHRFVRAQRLEPIDVAPWRQQAPTFPSWVNQPTTTDEDGAA